MKKRISVVKPVKAWAVMGTDNVIGMVTNRHGAHTGQYAIYETDTNFSKQIMKDYKLKIIPVLISPINKPKK